MLLQMANHMLTENELLEYKTFVKFVEPVRALAEKPHRSRTDACG